MPQKYYESGFGNQKSGTEGRGRSRLPVNPCNASSSGEGKSVPERQKGAKGIHAAIPRFEKVMISFTAKSVIPWIYFMANLAAIMVYFVTKSETKTNVIPNDD
jgi:hypothetical protein